MSVCVLDYQTDESYVVGRDPPPALAPVSQLVWTFLQAAWYSLPALIDDAHRFCERHSGQKLLQAETKLIQSRKQWSWK